MTDPQRPPPNTGARAFAHATVSAFEALIDSPGRRGVRIFGLPRDQLIIVCILSTLFLLPFILALGLMPVWDRVGEFSPWRQLHAYIAPAVNGLSDEVRFERLHVKRFLTSCVSLVELTFLSNFIALLSPPVRKHALLVWTCYDRAKVYRYLLISGLVFGALWFFLFVDWWLLKEVTSSGRGSPILYSVLAIPFATFVFGHMLTIVGLGTCRSITRKMRRR